MRLIVISLIAAVLILAASPWIDLSLSSFIYKSHGGFYNNAYTEFFFIYGPWPAWIAAFLSLFVLLTSRFFQKLKPYRNPALLYLLTFALGSLLVNGVFKEFWPRPRPVRVEGLGGSLPFHFFFEPLFGSRYKSFPSGHASVGFVFFALYFGGKKWHLNTLKIAGLSLAIVLGIGLSLLRILMGGHFFSDVFFSAVIMWFTPLILLKLWKN